MVFLLPLDWCIFLLAQKRIHAIKKFGWWTDNFVVWIKMNCPAWSCIKVHIDSLCQFLTCHLYIFQGQEKFKQPWNSLANVHQKSQTSAPDKPSGKEKQSQCSKTPHSFTKTWKYELKTKQDRFDYLCQMGGQHLGQLFKAEIPMGLFGEIVDVLCEGFHPQHCDIVIDILSHLSTTNRFSLTIEFLTSKEKDNLKDLFRKINDVPSDESGDESRGRHLKELLKVYKVNL